MMYERVIKRLLDFLLSLCAIIILSPLYLILAICVRIGMGKPILFSQERIGKDEKIFRLYKFRSMTNEKDKDGKLLPEKDRLTKFGIALRSSSLDELPEIFSILKRWFLEINFRNTALGYSTTAAGMPQVTLWCDCMEKGRIGNVVHHVPKGLKAMAECFDYDARVKTGIITKKEWLKQYKACQCKLYKGHGDNVPFYLFMWYKLTKMHKH